MSKTVLVCGDSSRLSSPASALLFGSRRLVASRMARPVHGVSTTSATTPGPPGAEGREGTEYVFGTTDAGRYLLVVMAESIDGRRYVVSARDRTDAEHQAFRQKGR